MGMEVKCLTEGNGTSAKFLIRGVETALMNALRRTITEDLAVMAIEDVIIYENTGIVFDEFLAHRLGLVPLTTDPKKYKLGEKVTLGLEKEGPATVYSRDIKCTDPKVEPVYKKIPLAKLAKGQKIKLELKAVMGTGKEHAKFVPAIVGYKHVPEIEIDEKAKNKDEIVKSCPVKILETKAGKVVVKNAWECTLCGNCRDVGGAEFVKIGTEKNNFVLSMELNGQLDAKETVAGAMEILEEKAKELEKEMK
ncbi:MAG: DNA-directed RNA polymerase subunit D [archaeon]